MMEITDARHIRLIEWLTTDPAERVPSTQEELAEELGVTGRTIRMWKERPDIIAAWEKKANIVAGSPERTQRVLDALYRKALDPEARDQVQAASAWAKIAGVIKPSKSAEPKPKGGAAANLSDEELEQLLLDAAQARFNESERK